MELYLMCFLCLYLSRSHVPDHLPVLGGSPSPAPPSPARPPPCQRYLAALGMRREGARTGSRGPERSSKVRGVGMHVAGGTCSRLPLGSCSLHLGCPLPPFPNVPRHVPCQPQVTESCSRHCRSCRLPYCQDAPSYCRVVSAVLQVPGASRHRVLTSLLEDQDPAFSTRRKGPAHPQPPSREP